jgi:hypothetical protein
MRIITPFVLCGAIVAAAVGALFLHGVRPAAGQANQPASQAADNGECRKLIHRYKTWTKVNPRPFQMQPASAAACDAPLPAVRPSPHLRKYVTVYVNNLGKDAMTLQKSPRFPVGSVIVKEKLAKSDSKSPELMTVMVKRDKDYNPDSGDWEYIVFDGAGKNVTARGKLENCGTCHRESPAKQSDYVYRDYYLPDSRKGALK